MKKTKIICTIGPACESEEMLEKLMLAGMDVARLNFSHGTHEEHKRNKKGARKAGATRCHYAGYQGARIPPAPLCLR